jgi:glutamate synthase (NADPH/NADH) small chain
MYDYIKVERVEPAVKLSQERVHNFKEIYEVFSNDTVQTQASRCIQCGIPYCSSGCPLNNNIPNWLKYIAEDNLKLAFDISNETSPFPEILGRICPHEKLCEGACTLYDGHGAVTIGASEIAITELGFEAGFTPEFQALKEGLSVGIVGSGPAGLSCANFLLRAGIKPVIYERSDKAGGLLTYGIPGFKLEKDIVERRVNLLLQYGMELRLNAEVGKNISFDELLNSHQAIFISTGATEGKMLNHEAYNKNNIFMAVPFLTHIQKKILGGKFDASYLVKDKDVVVIGGGDTAMDCVRTAAREGAKSIKCYYRRDEISMPGSKKEVKAAKEEGVEFVFNKMPAQFLMNNETEIYALQFNHTVASGEENGRIAFVEQEENAEVIEADIFILALGFDQEKVKYLNDFGINTAPNGSILVSEDNKTTREGVFAGGDAVRGADLAVRAALDGREAASNICAFIL